ncbi:MAG: ABC transporter permease [Planctomycetes bacterium]|nr:ABC transporter permease [Planctomycetota bacterium]
MRTRDLAGLALGALRSHRLRTGLTALGIAVGIFAVVLLTALGTGLKEFALAEFTRFGTNHISVQPGRTETHGLPGGMIHNTRPLTFDDAEALRRVAHVMDVCPQVTGNAEAEFEQRTRRITVFGGSPEAARMFHIGVLLGTFLPDEPQSTARAFAVLGSKVHRELFGGRNPLGARIRIAQQRFTVVGVVAPRGDILGFDLDEVVYVPTARAMALFDRRDLQEIHLTFDPGVPSATVGEAVRRLLVERHGREDFTIVRQEAMLEAMGSVLDVLTFAVGALGGISLLVGGVGVLTILTIAVAERTHEIGLLVALGATRRQVLTLFLAEAVVLAGLGGVAGLASGYAFVFAVTVAVPRLPAQVTPEFAVLAVAVSAAIGLVAGVLPARRAARLDPIESLRAE